jgi:alanyl-tRNA synthetase
VCWAVFDAPDLGLAGVRDLADRAKGLFPSLVVAVFGREGGRVPFVIVCQGVPPAAHLAAGELAKIASRHLGGGGGGRPDLAQGQGQDAKALPAAIEEVAAAVEAGIGRL